MPAAPEKIEILARVAAFAQKFDAWVCDIWGVLHNGVTADAGAVAAAIAFRRQGGSIALVTNAPRPHTAVREQLDRLGIGPDAYDAVITSGDVTRSLIAPYAGRTVLKIGPPRDDGIYEGVALRVVEAADAEVAVCSGLYDDTRETAETYRGLFEGLVTRRVPMICANPDLMVDRGGTIVPCAGALADLYGRMGGAVTYAGKPHLPIYQRAFEAIAAARGENVAASRILGIGDGIETDIRGAAAAGIPALYVASAIHHAQPLTPASLDRLFAGRTFRPIAAQATLAW